MLRLKSWYSSYLIRYLLLCCPELSPQISGMFAFEFGAWVTTSMSSAHTPPKVSSESDGPMISNTSKSKRNWHVS